MEHNSHSKHVDSIPEIYCAISVLLHKDADVTNITKEFQQIGIHDMKVRNPRCDPSICIDIAIVRNEPLWELSSALDKMFLQINPYLRDFKEIVKKYNGEVYIDVAFYQYGTYPALVISGDNMKKIHYLEANISIDPYDLTPNS